MKNNVTIKTLKIINNYKQLLALTMTFLFVKCHFKLCMKKFKENLNFFLDILR